MTNVKTLPVIDPKQDDFWRLWCRSCCRGMTFRVDRVDRARKPTDAGIVPVEFYGHCISCGTGTSFVGRGK